MHARIIFANILQGMIHCGYNEQKENILAGFHPEKYVQYFAAHQPDILCLAECVIDDAYGNSALTAKLSSECGLPFVYNLVGEKAFLLNDKFYGLAICSKFPISEYSTQKLANPQLEIIRPNGDYWRMHDKFIQKATVNVAQNKSLRLINTHLFPFQHFERNFWDAEFADLRKQWAAMLLPDSHTSLICGDFNTVGISIKKAFPELKIGENLHSLVNYDGKKYQPKYPYDTQIEYILATPDIKLIAAEAKMVYSDHPFLIADVEI